MNFISDLGSRFKAEFVGQVVATTSGALLTIVLARLLDPEGYGLLFLAMSIFGLFKFVSMLGIAKSGARYIAEYKEQDSSQIVHILKIVAIYSLITTLVTAAVLFFSSRHIASFLDEPRLTEFLLLGTLFMVFATVTENSRYILQGFEDNKLASAINIIDRLGRLVLAVGFVILGFGAIGALAGHVVSFTLASLCGLYLIYRNHYQQYDNTGTENPGLRRKIKEYMLPLTLTRSANILDKRVDVLLIGYFLTPISVSYYIIGRQVVRFTQMPASALGFTLSPTYGAEKARGNTSQISRIYEKTLVYSLLLYVPAAAGLILVAEPTIELVFGAEYLGGVVVLQIFGLYAVLQAITNITSMGLDYLGRARVRAIAKAITSVMNVFLNLLLIPVYGVAGAAVATVITHTLYTGVNMYAIYSEFHLRFGHIARQFVVIVLITLCMSAVVYASIGFINSLFTLAAVVGIGVLTWGVLSILTGLLDIHELAPE